MSDEETKIARINEITVQLVELSNQYEKLRIQGAPRDGRMAVIAGMETLEAEKDALLGVDAVGIQASKDHSEDEQTRLGNEISALRRKRKARGKLSQADEKRMSDLCTEFDIHNPQKVLGRNR